MKRAPGLCLCLFLAGCYLTVPAYKKNPSLPPLSGRIEAPGLRGEVDVYRDKWGVPHVFTECEHDLFWTVGYIHAQDRLWEMVFLRAISSGRMAELLGDVSAPGMEAMGLPLSTVGIDRAQRAQGMKFMGEVGAALLKENNPEVYYQLLAYCAGINHFLETHDKLSALPVEFQVLRVKPEPFAPEDVISLGRFLGATMAGNMGVELLRYAVTQKYGADTAWTLFPLHDAPGPTAVPKEMLENALGSPRDLPPGGRPPLEALPDLGLNPDDAVKLLTVDKSIKRYLNIEAPLCSNNWVISPKLSATGHALFANDPHLQHMEPSLFYLIHLKGPDFDVYGATFPGCPYPALGHTRTLAWGATTTLADVQDLFIEKTDDAHPGRYEYKGEWKKFVEREEIIRVRVGPARVNRRAVFKQTVHGPVINEIASGMLGKGAPPVALRWTGWDFDANTAVFDALASSASVDEFMEKYKQIPPCDRRFKNIALMYDRLMRGSSIQDFEEAMDLLDLPNQAWVAADADGHIAFIPGGLVPVRQKGIGVAPVPGESGDYDWKGFIPLSELPRAIDPARGFVVTANNEIVDAEWYPYVFNTNYGPGWRAWRIQDLIDELKPLDLDEMKTIQNDILVQQAKWEVPIILRAAVAKNPTDLQTLRAISELRKWDYVADLDSTETVVFYQFNNELRRNILEDELDEKDYEAYLSFPEMEIGVAILLERGESPLFDDKRTPDKVEDMGDMVVKSLHDAMAAIEHEYGEEPSAREWGKLHWIKFYHPLGFGPLKDMIVGPFALTGAAHTVRNAAPAGSGKAPWKVMAGPVFRHLIDLGDPDGSLVMIDGSQSGQWLSPHYQDLHPLWVNGEYIPALMDLETIREQTKDHLILSP